MALLGGERGGQPEHLRLVRVAMIEWQEVERLAVTAARSP